MLTDKQMLEIAEQYVLKLEEEANIELIIIDNTIKKKYGNVFMYTSRDETIDILGNAPFLVEKESGRILEFGTFAPTEYFIEEYEAGRWN